MIGMMEYRRAARGVTFVAIVALLLGTLGFGRAGAAGPIVQIDPGDNKAAFVAESGRGGRLYALFGQTSGALRFSGGTGDGTAWETPRPFFEGQGGRLANYPRLAVADDGTMHATWADNANSGQVQHAVYRPGPGTTPSDLGAWTVTRIDNGGGKNPGLALDPARGNLYVTWDDGSGVFGRRWTPGGGWDAPARLGDGRLSAVATTPDGKVHVVSVAPDRAVVYAQFDGGGAWGALGGTARLSTNRADHWPQIVGDSIGAVHVVWSQSQGLEPLGRWEVYYARRAANGVWNGGGGGERVSRNRSGGLHRWPTVQLDAANTPWIAWEGDETGNDNHQIFERRRGSDADPWPDYADPAPFCVSCGAGGDAQFPRYGWSSTGALHLVWVQQPARGVRQWGVRYSLRQAGERSLPPSGPPEYCFPATNKCLSGLFYRYWAANGGLDQQGYPLSDEITEINPADGRAYRVQYFERARFEYHPEGAGTPYEVLLGLLGREQYAARYPGGRPPGGDGDVCFAPTGRCIRGAFYQYWLQHGGLAQQGYPLSDEIDEVNPADGRTYRVQYFERARFEYHPEGAGTPYEVLLGLLGREQYAAR